MIEVERDGKTFKIPSSPGIYTIEDERVVYGGAFRVAHDGEQAVYFPSRGYEYPSKLNQIDWRLARKIENSKVKVGR
jgi:hypothetical protein